MIQCSARDRDNYDRMLAVCDIAGEDLNAWMVRQGWAVAYTRYSKDYVEQEKEARAMKRNIWSGTFVLPEDYRHRGRPLSSE
ncbi:MAG: thermonuclease family protein [Gammaproteobacteria bacterium]